jgi:hypothetical protein
MMTWLIGAPGYRTVRRYLLIGAVLALSAFASDCGGANVYVGVGYSPYCCGPYYGGRPVGIGRPYGYW